MKEPTEDQFSRIHARIEELEGASHATIVESLGRWESEREDPLVLTFLRLNFQLPQPPEVHFKEGERIADRYTIRSELGRGGMGVVYRATQDLTQRDVALKVIHPRLACPQLLRRFEEEIAILGKLSHPSIVPIYDAGKHADLRSRRETIFYAMQLVEGRSAQHYVKENSLSHEAVLELLIRIAEAVQYAHEHRIVHRDLKPANILVDSEGSPYLLDFGLALVSGSSKETGSILQSVSGTPRYMSPEQFEAGDLETRLSPAVDIYALGVTGFELMTGESPYVLPSEPSWNDIANAVLEVKPRGLCDILPQLDQGLSEVIAKAMARSASERYFSAAAFGKALSAQLSRRRQIKASWRPSIGLQVPNTQWLLDRKLGEGGMGEVWLANHQALGCRVLKFCDDPTKVRTLKREMALFRILHDRLGDHPHFVRLHDVSIEDPPFYLMMDYVEGGDYRSWTEQCGGVRLIPLAMRIEIVIQAAEAIQAAHEGGVLHCDIKPGNLLLRHVPALDSSDRSIHVCIADFGVGRLSMDESRGRSTRLGIAVTWAEESSSEAGTHLYMAPELFSGSPPSVSSDVYSLGVVLYQSLVGDFSKPITVDWDKSIEDRHLREDLHRCFTRIRGERFSSAGELAESLRRLEARRMESELRRTELQERERQAYRRGMIRAASLTAAIVCLISGLVFQTWNESNRSKMAISLRRLTEAEALTSGNTAGEKEKGIEMIRGSRSLLADPVRFRSVALTLMASVDLLSKPMESHRMRPTPSAQWLATSPEGHLTAGVDGLRMWMQSTNGAMGWFPLRTPNSPIRSMEMGKQGRIIVARCESGQTILIRQKTDSGSGLHYEDSSLDAPALSGPVALSPRDDSVAIADEDGGILGWDASGEAKQRLHFRGTLEPYRPESRKANTLAFNPDGNRLAVTSLESHHVCIWNWLQGTVVAWLYHRAPVVGGVWLDSRRYLTACQDGKLNVWKITEHGDPVLTSPSATLSCNGTPRWIKANSTLQFALTIDENAQAVLWDLQRLKVLRKFSLLEVPRRLATFQQGWVIESTRPESELQYWELYDRDCFNERALEYPMDTLCYDSSGQRLAATGGSLLALFDVQLQSMSTIPVALAQNVAWLPRLPGEDSEERILFSTRDGPRLILIHATTPQAPFGSIVNPWPSLRRMGSLLASSPKHVFVSSREELYSSTEDLRLSSPLLAPWLVDRLTVSSDGGWISIANHASKQLQIWAMPSGRLRLKLDHVSGADCFDPAAKRWACAVESELRIYDTTTWAYRRLMQIDSYVQHMQFSSDGRRLFWERGNSSGEIEAIDSASGERLLQLKSPTSRRILAMAASPRGEQLAVSTEDGFLQTWDLKKLEDQLTALGLHW